MQLPLIFISHFIFHSSLPTCRTIAQQVKSSWRQRKPLHACMEQVIMNSPTPTVVYVEGFEAFHSRSPNVVNIKLFSIMLLLNEGLYTHVMISNVKVGYSHFHDSSNQIFDYNQWPHAGSFCMERPGHHYSSKKRQFIQH